MGIRVRLVNALNITKNSKLISSVPTNPYCLSTDKTFLNRLFIFSGHEAIVNLLIDNGANVNVFNKGRKSALHMAAFNGCNSMFNS